MTFLRNLAILTSMNFDPTTITENDVLGHIGAKLGYMDNYETKWVRFGTHNPNS